ncbi:uncharacterized protein KD926_002070 [Aspergillus affinis]|uniref:uncharacterized protein n=1 Tax=Aspergillus affinis TaxID=1070780 RepID=UPI0022FF1AB1|nr:uncharacterized protein KD926_002070 [Aspergillus affinis]KAI9036307.1 hypothetical protein KD926_002070 [Aspergillus affinis]
MAYVRELLQAATTISNTDVREEDMSYLLSHRSDFETALAKLHALLGSPSKGFPASVASPADEILAPRCSSSPETIEQRFPVSGALPRCTARLALPSSTSQATNAEGNEALPGSVKKVLDLLDKKKKVISTFTYRPGIYPNVCSDNANEDVRVTIIQFVSQKRTPTDYYLAGKAALSLANEFLDWQGEVGIPGRLDVLSNDMNDKTGACYREYADICPSFRDKERASEYIEFGIKLRFFAILCLVRLRGPIIRFSSSSTTSATPSTLSDTSSNPSHPSDTDNYSVPETPSGTNPDCDPNGSGASSLRQFAVVYPFFFLWRAFYRCKYDHLPALANAFLSSPYWRELVEAKNWEEPIEDAIPKGNGKHTLTDASSERQKRQRNDQPESQPSEDRSVLFLNDSSTAHHFLPADPQILSNRTQYATTRHIWPLDSPVFDLQQDTPTRTVWPLGSIAFPDQPPARNIYPVGSTAFSDSLQAISPADLPTPCGLDLSTPEIAGAVESMLGALGTASDKQPNTANVI